MQSKKINQKGTKIFLISILIVPTIHWFIFWLYVNSSSFVLAFKTQQGAWSLDNFRELWRQLNNPYGTSVGRALINTLKYWAVNIGITFPLSIVIAYFIFKKIRFYKFFRIMFFFPAIVTPIILVTVYTMWVAPGGPVDKLLQVFGGEIPPQGLFNPDPSAPNRATNTILIYCVWTGFGTNVILIGSAMARMPDSVLEAASLDGCGLFRELVQLILPLIWPTLSTLLLLSLTGFFSSSGPILLFAPDGGAGTTTLSFWIFKLVYGSGAFGTPGGSQDYGLVSATGLVFTVVWIPVVLFVRWLMEKVPTVEY